MESSVCKNIQAKKTACCSTDPAVLSPPSCQLERQVMTVFSWQLSWESKVHSWHFSISRWTLRTWEDTSGFPSNASAEQSGGGLLMDWCTGGPRIFLCRYVDAWQTAATGWGDKTAHFILGTSDSAASSTESDSTGPDWNWITQRQEGVGTGLSEQSQKTTSSGLWFYAEGGSVEYDIWYLCALGIPWL